MPGGARHLRQAFGADYHQGNDGDKHHFGKADIKH
jgi:hypothetical protein